MVIDLSPLYGSSSPFDRLFESFWSPLSISQRGMSYPPLNISEDQASIIVRCEIPGMDMSEIDLTLTEGSLVIKGERKSPKGKYFRQERPTGFFQRIVNIKAPIDRNAVKASLRDGLLEIVLPKAEETFPKKIQISAS
ncbi:Hsp20/alpha crystallin family protein [Desulfovibrio inopinatus]|uniref:Hsp20/alpha crystallin family protein n=1 Tax=Desulfovibrio inopinatus TaxID=102109 RepID=UPI0004138672|nr:Hsp20/alpha crystallin family protein [Desulfovibrio inopinatus]